MSSRTPMLSRWAVEIIGSPITVNRVENYISKTLYSSTDTFISRFRELAVIRSELWDLIDDPETIAQLARTEIALLQGLTKLSGGASPLDIGTVFEVDGEDNIIKQTVGTINEVYILSHDIEPASLFRRRLEIVRNNDYLAGAVIELSSRPDWIRVYKAL